MSGAEQIAAERQRQIAEEGWLPEHDAEHEPDTLAIAAACYAVPERHRIYILGQHFQGFPSPWPWEARWWKPTPEDRVRELTKAGALIAAEIDRLLADTQTTASPSSPKEVSRSTQAEEGRG